MTGFGTSRDKTTYGRFLRSAVLDDERAALDAYCMSLYGAGVEI